MGGCLTDIIDQQQPPVVGLCSSGRLSCRRRENVGFCRYWQPTAWVLGQWPLPISGPLTVGGGGLYPKPRRHGHNQNATK